MLLDIARRRLRNQQIGRERFDQPDQVPAWLGAMQAQDYAGVKWAIGLRCQTASDTNVEQAIADREIIRTWLMRGTLQIVAAEDVHWMVALLGPRLIKQSARRRRELGLDDTLLARSSEVLSTVLHGRRQLTRTAVLQALEQQGISTVGQRGYHILRHAGLQGHICFGPMQNKEQTFVLLEEWAPQGQKKEREEALAELAQRYFTSHGPATLEDFVWWSGLTKADARSGLKMCPTELQSADIDSQTYWFWGRDFPVEKKVPFVALLPAFDEYYLGYRDRDAVVAAGFDKKAISNAGVFRPMIVVDGQIIGTWQKKMRKSSVVVHLKLFRSLTGTEKKALDAAAGRYGAFLEMAALLNEDDPKTSL